MHSSKITKNLIQKQISSLETYFNKHLNDNESNKLIAKEANRKLEECNKILMNAKRKIAVVANMSSGKSTFINALFGEHVLPTSSKATTDCATYIHTCKDQEKHAMIFFEDERDPIKLNADELSELEEYAKKDEDCKDKKYHHVAKIDLYYPLKHFDTKQDFEIIFIDTPGPNSTGGNYADKHKSATRQVLREANAALFLFDYGQLDANLSSDEQGLWHTIETKTKEDKTFELFLIINKIDMALNDYSSVLRGCSQEEEFVKMRELWGTEEQKAIDKLVNAAKKHHIQDPKIFGVSAQYVYLQRNQDSLITQDRRQLRNLKERFEDIWEEDWEEKFIDYLGMEKLEKSIHDLLKNLNQHVLQESTNHLKQIINEEKSGLSNKLRQLKDLKIKEDLKKNLVYLENEVPKLQEEMKEKTQDIKNEAQEQIQEIFEDAVNENFHSKVDELVKRSISFLHYYAEGKKSQAKQLAANYDIDQTRDKIRLAKDISFEEAKTALLDYIASELKDRLEDFNDLQLQIKNIYAKINEFNYYQLMYYQNTLKNNLNSQELEVKNETLQEIAIDFTLLLDQNVDYLNGNIKHLHLKEIKKEVEVLSGTFWKPWTWLNTKKKEVTIRQEQNEINIDPKTLKHDIQEHIKSNLAIIQDNAIKQHNSNLNKLCDDNLQLFDDFKELKKVQIEELEQQLKETEVSQKQINLQLQELQKIIFAELYE